MAVRVVSQEIPEGLYGINSAGDYLLLRDNGLEKHFQSIPGAAGESGEKFSII